MHIILYGCTTVESLCILFLPIGKHFSPPCHSRRSNFIGLFLFSYITLLRCIIVRARPANEAYFYDTVTFLPSTFKKYIGSNVPGSSKFNVCDPETPLYNIRSELIARPGSLVYFPKIKVSAFYYSIKCTVFYLCLHIHTHTTE